MAQTKIRKEQISGGIDGWIPANETWTYASATTFTISGDKTGKYQKGDKIKLTQTTDKYFYVTDVSYSSPNTTVTVYGGTDYDLANAAITSPYYSMVRSPQGFPMSPVKWSVIYRETGQNRTQSSPTNDAWYNINSYQLSIPIGSWEVGYEVFAGGSTTNATTYIQVFTTLSTSTSSASDSDFTALTITDHASAITTMGNFRHRHKTLDLTSKTTYYLLTRLFTGGTTNQIFNNSIACATIIRAVCAYL